MSARHKKSNNLKELILSEQSEDEEEVRFLQQVAKRRDLREEHPLLQDVLDKNGSRKEYDNTREGKVLLPRGTQVGFSIKGFDVMKSREDKSMTIKKQPFNHKKGSSNNLLEVEEHFDHTMPNKNSILLIDEPRRLSTINSATKRNDSIVVEEEEVNYDDESLI